MSNSFRATTDEPRDEGELVRWAGESPDLPELDVDALAESLTGAWQRTVRRRQRRRILTRIAAVMLPAVVALAWFLGVGRETTVAKLEGTRSTSENLAFQAQEQPLRVGTVIETSEQLWIVRHRAGHAFRIGPQSRVVLTSNDRLRLELGSIFVDAEDPDLTISTPSAEVSHIGTSYGVQVFESGTTWARVRKGRVVMRSDSETVELGKAEGAEVNIEGVLKPLQAEDLASGWQWLEDAYMPLGISDPTVMDVLEWAADQTGRRLEVDRKLPAEAGSGALAVVTGLPADIRPLPAAQAAVAGSDLELVIQDDVLIVRANSR